MARVKKETKTAQKVKKAEKKAPKAAKKSVKEIKKIEKPIKAEKVKVSKPADKPKGAKKIKTGPKEDTGSVSFQIDNFSDKIKSLAKHLKTHIHDFDSRRGLLIMVGKRRKLLNYLKKSDPVKYEEVAKSLKLKA